MSGTPSGPVAASGVAALAGLDLVPLGEDDAGACVDGVCVLPGTAAPAR